MQARVYMYMYVWMCVLKKTGTNCYPGSWLLLLAMLQAESSLCIDGESSIASPTRVGFGILLSLPQRIKGTQPPRNSRIYRVTC